MLLLCRPLFALYCVTCLILNCFFGLSAYLANSSLLQPQNLLPHLNTPCVRCSNNGSGYGRYLVIRVTVFCTVDVLEAFCLTFRGPCIVSIFLLIYFKRDAILHSLFISGKQFYMFRVVSPPIIRSTHNCIYSIWYLLTVTATWLYCGGVGGGLSVVWELYPPVLVRLQPQIGTIPTPHSGPLQLSHNRGR